jgi:opacity protein-like surface antigen
MKKLTLTFCALFALLVVAPAIYADGPERMSGKDKEVMQPAPPVCDFYRAHEWDLSIWGAWAFGGTTGQNDVADDDPFFPDEDPFLQDIGTGFFVEPQIYNRNERINIGQVSKNELFARDDTWGGGVDFKYFWSKYFGAGIEGVGLAAKTNFAGGGLLTLTGRFPFGRFAPYVTGGLGFIDGGATTYKYFNEKHEYAQFTDPVIVGKTITGVSNEFEFWSTDPVYNHHIRALGQIGVGLEYRMTCHIGLMADFTWNFVFGQGDHSDKLKLRTLQGTSEIDDFGIPISQFVVINQAFDLQPGHGSDNQDFGMVRFGVTFSY